MQELNIKVNVSDIKDTMKKENANVSGTSIALAAIVDGEAKEVKIAPPKTIGFTDKNSKTPVSPDTVFGAASLSKVVFAYLVLKLIEKNKANPENLGLGKFDFKSNGITQFNLDTPLHQILPMEEFSEEFKSASEADKIKAKAITARMVLSHQTGIRDEKGSAIQFEFKPNSGKFSYSGIAIAYLQKVIEKLTDSNLEALAQEHVFGPGPNALDMKNSSFTSNKNKPTESPHQAKAANSLFTTASDYAKFAAAWMNDPSEEMQAAFEPAVTMENDDWAIRQNVPKEDRENLGWGLGWGLQLENGCDIYLMPNFKNDLEEYKPEDLEKYKNRYLLFGNKLRYINADKTVSKITLADPDKLLEYITDFNKDKEKSEKIHLSNQQFKNLITDNGGHKLKRKAVRAYHSGDMDKWRAWVVMDLEKKTAIVYFANSKHGHMLADQIISPNIELDHALNAFFIKWGFMREIPENFEGSDIHVMPAFPECNLYLMSSLPEDIEELKKYKNNYILYNNQLRYINSDGTFKIIKINDTDKFLKDISGIKQEKPGIIPLSKELKKLIRKNGGHVHFPEDPEKYKNKYILRGDELFYVYANKTIKFIKLNDPNKFVENIKEFNKNNAEEIHLSSEQFKNYITLNGGHVHWHILEQEQFNHIGEYVNSRGTPTTESAQPLQKTETPASEKVEEKTTTSSSYTTTLQRFITTHPSPSPEPEKPAEEKIEEKKAIPKLETPSKTEIPMSKPESEPDLDQDKQKTYQTPTPSGFSTKFTPDKH